MIEAVECETVRSPTMRTWGAGRFLGISVALLLASAVFVITCGRTSARRMSRIAPLVPLGTTVDNRLLSAPIPWLVASRKNDGPRYLVQWIDRSLALGTRVGQKLILSDIMGRTHAELHVDGPVLRVFVSAVSGRILVVTDQRDGLGSSIRSFASTGAPLSGREMPAHPVAAISENTDANGRLNLLVGLGGDSGVLGIDEELATVLSIQEQPVVYDVRSSVRASDWILVVGGDYSLMQLTGKLLPRVAISGTASSVSDRRNGTDTMFATHGCLLRSAEHALRAVLGGTQYGSRTPILVCVDVDDDDQWRLRLPASCAELEAIETDSAPPSIVIAMEDGELVVLNDKGDTLASEVVPRLVDDVESGLQRLLVGRLSSDEWFIGVWTVSGWYSMRLRS